MTKRRAGPPKFLYVFAAKMEHYDDQNKLFQN